MNPVHQLVHTLSYGDAISGEVLALQRVFHSMGLPSEIYSIHAHPKLKDKAKDYRELDPQLEGEVILHYSLGSPLNELFRSLSRATRTLIYHNLTPARWFASINPRVTADIEDGLSELPLLCQMSHRILADSAFNASELQTLGFPAKVLQLPIDPARWQVPANQGIAELVRNEGGIHVLHVGRLAPNKCVEDVIKSFHFLNRYITKNSRLWLVGIDTDTELYSFGLKRLIRHLNLNEAVNFCGQLSDGEVRALYENCTLYICMSEHEGFCLPVIEAMHFGLPVIAYASSALPDTVGDGGILVREKRHPELGELMAQVASDAALRASLVAAGKTRVQGLTFDKFEHAVRELFQAQVEARNFQ